MHSLNLTDIHTAWGETASALGTSQHAVQRALDLRQALPLRLRGIDSDNGSEFINKERVRPDVAAQLLRRCDPSIPSASRAASSRHSSASMPGQPAP